MTFIELIIQEIIKFFIAMLAFLAIYKIFGLQKAEQKAEQRKKEKWRREWETEQQKNQTFHQESKPLTQAEFEKWKAERQKQEP